MKRLIAIAFALMWILSCALYVSATETDLDSTASSADIDVYVTVAEQIEGVYYSPVTDGNAQAAVDGGITVGVANAPEGAVQLRVIPIPDTEEKAWTWVEEALEGKAKAVHAFGIYFENQNGNKIAANGTEVTINCPHCSASPYVYSLDTAGNLVELKAPSAARTVSVTFAANGSDYYILAEALPTFEVSIEKPQGGTVEVDNPSPKAGDLVTITPHPDAGKEIDKVIVEDASGKSIPVKDNGNGTFTYEQPEGNATIKVTFKDRKDPNSPQTGDNSHLMLWWILLAVSAVALVLLYSNRIKRKEVH